MLRSALRLSRPNGGRRRSAKKKTDDQEDKENEAEEDQKKAKSENKKSTSDKKNANGGDPLARLKKCVRAAGLFVNYVKIFEHVPKVC